MHYRRTVQMLGVDTSRLRKSNPYLQRHAPVISLQTHEPLNL
jgi:hypothetical protein